MQFKIIRKIIFILFISAASLSLLSACAPNPLKTTEPKTAGEFLVHASQEAEKKLKLTELEFYFPPGGYYYRDCMRDKVNKTLCQKLYLAMVDYAKTTDQFKRLTVNDLTDRSIYKKTEEAYERARFNGV
jgi:hypothetical protein